MSQTLNEARQQIDSIDSKILDLLMQRAELAMKIGAEKRKNGLQVVQPDREAALLRRLLARHRGALPREAVVRIWRELVGAASLLQNPLKVVVAAPDDHTGLIQWDLAKDYFSSVLPMNKSSNALGALAMVREGEATFAVLPWPTDGEATPWWQYLQGEYDKEDGMRIMARLPLGDPSTEDDNPEYKALVVMRGGYHTSGDDRSFLVLDVEQGISRARLVDKAAEVGLTARSLHSAAPGAGALHLLEVDEYVAVEDPRLRALLEKLDCAHGRCVCIGGYATPPIYGDKVGKNAV